MTSPVFTPMQMFYSTSGLPLTDGYIYIGTASQNPQTNPIAVYWDAAGTIPAAQPIRTSGGYPVRNGSPATVFVLATDFSLIVRDKSSKLVFSRLSGNAFSAEWVTYTPSGTGAVATTVQAKLRESVSVLDFGAVGNGVTDDTVAFTNAAAAAGSQWVFVPSAAYKITGTVTGNFYSTGTVTIVSGTVKSIYDLPSRVNKARHPSNTNTILGDDSLDDVNLTGTIGYRNTAIGVNALRDVATASTAGGSNTAVGFGALTGNVEASGNTAVGALALTSASGAGAVHNSAVGYQSQTASVSGIQNNSFGFRTLYTLVSGNNNCAFGESSLYTLNGGNGNTGFGYQTLYSKPSGDFSVAVGYQSCFSETTGYGTVAVGYKTLFSSSTSAAHTVVGYNAASAAEPGDGTTAIGYEALLPVNKNGGGDGGAYNTGVGYWALRRLTTGASNTAVGQQSGAYITNGSENVTVGANSGSALILGDFCTFVGATTAQNLEGNNNTVIGYRAGYFAGATNYSNITALGANALVTGSNQVQLGDGSTTTYVFGTVQTRSDARDKADVRDTVLGLSFIQTLRPVDFKWDYRQDYDGAKDGSKKRTRFHHGFIAQEVKAACDAAGVDFGGYQDHKIGGGQDVLTLGYEELIAPLVKAIQELKVEFDKYKASHP